ncbi:MAG: NAD(P)H-dependent flavin oxidoreductase [Bosea sp. (in: a-proteobacteria)]
MTRLRTRLTEQLGIAHPILSAPMALAGGGALAAAVTRAGGLGLIGGGYGDAGWLGEQFLAAGNEAVGCGFITWSLAKQPELLEQALSHRPRAIMLSFGDPRPFAPAIAAAGTRLICQCQTMSHVREALEAGASIIVAQGAEAGGHGQSRATMTLVPEAADHLAKTSPGTLLVAAGGIADGRGLAAALMLGADGVLIGTRLWASREALTLTRHQQAAVAADGDASVRTSVPDVARRLEWPKPFTVRVANNAYIQRWQGREAELYAAADVEAPRYREAFMAGDPDNAGVFFGEAAGLIHDVPPAGEIITRMVSEAADLLGGAASKLV